MYSSRTNPLRSPSYGTIGPVVDGGVLVVLILREQLETQKRGDAAATLQPRAGVDPRIPIVEEDDGSVVEVKPVSILGAAEAELIPEPTDESDPFADTERLDLSAGRDCNTLRVGDFPFTSRIAGQDMMGSLTEPLAVHGILLQLLIHSICTPPVGHDIRDTSLSSGPDQLAVCLGGRRVGYGDDEDLLASEGFHDLLVLSARVRAVTICLPVLTSASVMYLPTVPPA